jgi:hypothetical protein
MKLTSITIKKLIKEELNAVLESSSRRAFCDKFVEENEEKYKDAHDNYFSAPNKSDYLSKLSTDEVTYLMCTANRFSFGTFVDELERRDTTTKEMP